MKNKRELRKIPVSQADGKAIEAARGCVETPVQYIAYGEFIKAEKMLCLNFYNREWLRTGNTAPEFRLFADKDGYITQMTDGTGKWKTGQLESIIHYCYYPDYRYNGWKTRVILSGPGTEKAIRAIAGNKGTALAALEDYQRNIVQRRLSDRHKVITDRIDKQMERIPALPADWESFLKNVAMPESRYIFYRYKKTRKPLAGFCTYCESYIKTMDAKSNSKGKCPNCGEEITYKATGIYKTIKDFGQAAILQRISPEEFTVRYFKMGKTFEVDELTGAVKQTIWDYERVREIYGPNGLKDYGYETFKSTGKTRWCEETYLILAQASASVYGSTIREVLAPTEFKYCALYEYATRYKGAPVHIRGYLRRYSQFKGLEYLVKLKLYNLAEACSRGEHFLHTINFNKQDIRSVLNIGKENLKILAGIDGTYEMLESLQFLEERGVRMKQAEFKEYFDFFGCHYFGEAVGLNNMGITTMHKIKRYLEEQRINGFTAGRGNGFTEWKDYIGWCKRLKYDMKNEFILYPKNLKEAHDRLYERIKELDDKKKRRERAKLNKSSKQLFAELRERYYYKSGGLIITAPEDLEDIRAEGQALHHCVGGYAERAARGETVILFIRKEKEPKKPYYTMEVNQSGIIVQCRGYGNAGKTKEIEALLKRWQKNYEKPAKKSA